MASLPSSSFLAESMSCWAALRWVKALSESLLVEFRCITMRFKHEKVGLFLPNQWLKMDESYHTRPNNKVICYT